MKSGSLDEKRRLHLGTVYPPMVLCGIAQIESLNQFFRVSNGVWLRPIGLFVDLSVRNLSGFS